MVQWLKDSVLPVQGTKYPSLMRKLRSHVLQGVAKRNKLKKKKKEQVRNSVDK